MFLKCEMCVYYYNEFLGHCFLFFLPCNRERGKDTTTTVAWQAVAGQAGRKGGSEEERSEGKKKRGKKGTRRKQGLLGWGGKKRRFEDVAVWRST